MQLALPSASTIKSDLKQLKMHPGISDNNVKHVRMKIAHMHPNANYVFILMDEVSLRHGLGLDQPSGTILGFNDDGNIRTIELVSPALYIMMSGTFVK